MTDKESKALGVVYAIFIGFLFGYLLGIIMCKKMPERFDIVQHEQECSCSCTKARYEAERKMRMELQSKVIALNTQLLAEKGILLG